MFNLQGSELVIILLLALVVLGPEKLPEAMRRLGQFTAQLKKMSSGFQQEFKAAVDEPMREVRKTADMLRDSMDFRSLQDGTRDEKPKSGDMASVTPAPAPDPTVTPTDEVPFQQPPVAAGQAVDVPIETHPPDPDGAVTDGAVTDGAVTDGAATADDLTDGAVTDGAATADDLTDGAVTEDEVTEDEVTREW